jgi:hypothetical protein
MAYETLKSAMNPILICAEYPREKYEAGTEVSFPLFVANDFSHALGEVSWSWEVFLGGSSIASGDGESEIPADSVVEIGEARATLPAPGAAVLRLHLSGRDLAVHNQYEFLVSGAADPPRRDPSAPGG